MLKSQIHNRAVEVARKYRACEVELIEVLQEVDRHKVYLHQGCNSLFDYVTKVLNLSQEVAYIYIGVARKAREVPALKDEIRQGKLSAISCNSNLSQLIKFHLSARSHACNFKSEFLSS